MRLSNILVLLVAVASPAGAAQSSDKLRTATETEIRQHLQRAGSLKDGTDGYQYLEGSSTGYKITDGKICVRKRNSVDCADVLFDGTRLELIDRNGNREIIGN
ncbi:hypothetical protein [Agrobacterium larrymoorei]|uniref:PepSY domain-containing protein n=1 Tax=Agrobacterium larrymoorei TaxID=160699 RepID=A0A4D7DUW5_9HYPH|nr:hypothetical protein [Agrobacterium larrymoorei]QCJ00822.1 hypothetical protein CFBP5473_22865 [Agrobacterium larrymoorei]QYA10486.1 hypothetical protein J5285_25115 [Agrobacterium larrymoorei]